VEQVFELAFLLLQPERPDRALLQIFFGLLQGGGGFGQRIGDVTDFGAEAGFDVEGPLGFFAAFLLQGGNLGVVCGDHCARVFLIAREFLLKLVDARSAGGERGLLEAVRQLQGFEIPANAWEKHILAARLNNYDPAALDQLCLTGAVGWGRLSPHPATLEDSGEGRWTSIAAIDVGAPTPVLTTALYERFTSRGEADFAGRVLSAMRLGFGGHEEPKG